MAGRGEEERGGAHAQGDGGDGAEVGDLGEASAQGRVQDLPSAPRAFEGAEAERVRYDAHRAHRHRRGGQDRAQKHPEERVEGAGRDRDEGDVVGEGPEQSLLYLPDRPAGERDRGDDAPEVPPDERYIRGGHGDVRARPNGDSEVRTRERGGVVDAVPDHRDGPARRLQLSHLRGLVPG